MLAEDLKAEYATLFDHTGDGNNINLGAIGARGGTDVHLKHVSSTNNVNSASIGYLPVFQLWPTNFFLLNDLRALFASWHDPCSIHL